jgi:hypothetical protein
MRKTLFITMLSFSTLTFVLNSCSEDEKETPSPAITAIVPISGKEGDAITITGSNFSNTASANTVSFNGVTASITSASANQIVVTVPLNATTGKVSVTVNGHTAQGPDFTVIPKPAIASVNLTVAVAGCQSLTITGSNFGATPAENAVTINGVAATVTTASATQLVVAVPANATTGVVQVTANGTTVTGPSVTVVKNEATTTMDAVDYTYDVVCGSMWGDNYTIAASGGFNSPKPSFAISFTGALPTTDGTYDISVAAERPGETWDFTAGQGDVTFDNAGKMTLVFSNLLLNGRSATPDKEFSAVIKVY